MSYTTIDLLRHGACEGGEILRGSTDDELSRQGWQQMHHATRNNPGWQRVISSPLKRCQVFARHLADGLAFPFHIEDDLREVHFGEWEGKSLKHLWACQPEVMARYFADPATNTPRDGEPITAVKTRLDAVWARLLEQYQNEHLLLVQHGGTIRLLLTSILGLGINDMQKFEVPHAGLTRIRVFHQQGKSYPMLVFHNAMGDYPESGGGT